MNEQNRKLSVVAYYLSKFDMDAIRALGYKNRTDAICEISRIIGNGNNYLKLRRDEFDVLTESHRRGYANRAPLSSVIELHGQLKDISFVDFTNIVSQLIHPPKLMTTSEIPNWLSETDFELSDTEIEAIINAKDSTSTVLLKQSKQKMRVYNSGIPENLKKLYQYRCQICGYSAEEYNAHIVEAHHILPFSEGHNNNANNIIILCPNHHRLVHQATPLFDRERTVFIFTSGLELQLKLNLHL